MTEVHKIDWSKYGVRGDDGDDDIYFCEDCRSWDSCFECEYCSDIVHHEDTDVHDHFCSWCGRFGEEAMSEWFTTKRGSQYALCEGCNVELQPSFEHLGTMARFMFDDAPVGSSIVSAEMVIKLHAEGMTIVRFRSR